MHIAFFFIFDTQAVTTKLMPWHQPRLEATSVSRSPVLQTHPAHQVAKAKIKIKIRITNKKAISQT